MHLTLFLHEHIISITSISHFLFGLKSAEERRKITENLNRLK